MSATIRPLQVVHNGYALHILSKSGRTLCGKPVATADRYDTPEAGARAWADGRQPHCRCCEERSGL